MDREQTMGEDTETSKRREQNTGRKRRWRAVQELAALLDKPLLVLSFVWLGLVVLEFTRGLSPALVNLTYVIWALFVIDFALGFLIAPQKLRYLRRHWLSLVSLALPAARVLRVFRSLRVLHAARAVRSVSLLRLLTSLNRGMRAIGATLAERGIGYVLAITALVIFGGAAGILLFENPASLRQAGYAHIAEQGAGLESYGEALWWTAMIVTTMGSDYWPKTAEGRILCWLLSIYAFAIFGYIAGTIASYFIGQGAAGRNLGGRREQDELREQVSGLRDELAAMRLRLQAS